MDRQRLKLDRDEKSVSAGRLFQIVKCLLKNECLKESSLQMGMISLYGCPRLVSLVGDSLK